MTEGVGYTVIVTGEKEGKSFSRTALYDRKIGAVGTKQEAKYNRAIVRKKTISKIGKKLMKKHNVRCKIIKL